MSERRCVWCGIRLYEAPTDRWAFEKEGTDTEGICLECILSLAKRSLILMEQDAMLLAQIQIGGLENQLERYEKDRKEKER